MKSILIADDDDFLRNNYCEILSNLGLNVLGAENGLKASILFVKEKPDLLITDIHMPVMDGLKLIANIRRVDKTIPIIAMSTDELLLNFALKNGANEKFSKKMNFNNLLILVDSLLEIERTHNSACR